jgi:hypothetical protein
MLANNKSLKADAVNGTRNGITSQLRHYVSCIASVPACAGNGFTLSLRHFVSFMTSVFACPA